MKKIILTDIVSYEDDDCGIIDGFVKCYLIDKLPNERDYFNYGDDKGYVIQITEFKVKEKDYDCYTLWYEKNLDDWNNQIINVANVCNVCIKK